MFVLKIQIKFQSFPGKVISSRMYLPASMYLFFQFNFRKKGGKISNLILCASSPTHVWPQQAQFMQFVSYYRVIVTVSGVHCHQSITSKLVGTQGNWRTAPSMLLYCTHGLTAPCASQCAYQLTTLWHFYSFRYLI